MALVENFGGKVRGQFLKSVSIHKRQYKSNCCQVVFPLLLITIIGIINLLIKLKASLFNEPNAPNVFFSSNYVPYARNCYNSEYCLDMDPQDYKCVSDLMNMLYVDNRNDKSIPIGDLSPYGNNYSTPGWATHNIQRYLYPYETNNQGGYTPSQYSCKYSPTLYPSPSTNAMSDAIFESEVYYQTHEWPQNESRILTGGIIINRLDEHKLDYAVQSGDEIDGMRNSWSSDRDTTRIMNTMHNAFLKFLNSSSNITIEIAQDTFQVASPPNIFFMTDAVSMVLVASALSFLLPVYMSDLVQERSEGVVDFMKLMGLETAFYWGFRYIFDYIIYLFILAIMIGVSFIYQFRFLYLTNPFYYLLLFFMWGHAQIAMSYFLTLVFKSPRTSTMFGYMVVLANILSGSLLSTLVWGVQLPSIAYLIYPPFAFFRGMALITMPLMVNGGTNIPFIMPNNIGAQLLQVYLFLAAETVILLAVTLFWDMVYQKNAGLWKNLLNCLKPITYCYKRALKKRQQQQPEASRLLGGSGELKESPRDQYSTSVAVIDEFTDVQKEKDRIINNQIPADSVFVIKLLRKVFYQGSRKKVALNDLCLSLNSNECFGLLGPNGAGKTTLISILSGLMPPTTGTASIAGFDINADLVQVRKRIGICPQFDVLFPDLTVEEHLLYYSRIKGIPRKQEREHVKRVIEEVGLEEARRRFARNLSGGMKRRLSLAIALTGNPTVVMLDEPTTGLDPASRRSVWEIVMNAKKNRCVMLTTHSMDEAEALCDRIGILAQGSLVCLGSLLHLKHKYGEGYKITITCDPQNLERAKSFITSLLPNAKHESSFSDTHSFRVPAEDLKLRLSRLFSQMESKKSHYGIKYWSINQASLEEVFNRLITVDEL